MGSPHGAVQLLPGRGETVGAPKIDALMASCLLARPKLQAENSSKTLGC